MIESLFSAGIGVGLIWIGVDMIRGGDWWSKLSSRDQDALIGLGPVRNDEVSQHGRDWIRSKYGGWFSATPLFGVLGVVVGLFFVASALGWI